MNWNTRAFVSEDKPAIIELLRRVWGWNHGPDFWDWLHKQNPAGYSIIFIAESGREIVGHVTGIPLQMKIEDEFAGYIGLSGVTHPDYRNQGIMRALLDQLVAEAAKKGLALGYAVTLMREPMQRVVRRVGATDTRASPMPSYYAILNLRRALRERELLSSCGIGALLNPMKHRKKRIDASSNLDIKELRGFDDSFDRLWSVVSKDYKSLIVKRSSDYLTWRYSHHPEQKYQVWGVREDGELAGFVVTRHDFRDGLHAGFIADMFGRRLDIMSALVAHVVDYFEGQGASYVKCELSSGHPYGELLKRFGFACCRSGNGLQFRIALPSAGVDQSWLVKRGHHVMTWGDITTAEDL
jgi:GNAT superfamily N-acetyltransferase